MSDHFKRTIVRFAIIFVGIVAMFLMVIFRIFYLQTAEREHWERLGNAKKVSSTKVVPATRGNIYDEEGNLLASSIPQYRLYMDTRVEALTQDGGALFWQYVDTLARGFSEIIGDKSATEYRKVMTDAFRKRQYIRLTYKPISYTQKKAIQAMPLVCRGLYKSGVTFEDINRRSKPFGSLGSRTIGNIYGGSGKGSSGLEKRFDDQLRGKDGLSSRQRVAGHWEYVSVRDTENGADVYTTLDVNLMDICESSLRRQLQVNQADWGCVVLMEVKTGEIKAMCNLNLDKKDGKYYETDNHAVKRVEPGSTFKTIALMAAMDDGKVAMDDSVEVWKKGWKYYDAKHTDAHPADTIYSIRNAMAVSSNIALAQIVTSGYKGSAKKFVQKLERMGLKDSVDYIIPGADQAKILVPKDTVTISRMAYGYSVEMSPLQVATFYNAIANDGKMIAPVLVKEVRKDGDVVERFESKVIRNSICGSSTLENIKTCLHDVVWDNNLGTASVYKWKGVIAKYKAQSQLVPIAGKTGTAQVIENGRYHSNKHRMSFVGYFPEDKPQYTCICVIHAPRNNGYYDAGMDCGSVVRHIAEKTMAYTNEYIMQDGNLVFKNK